MIDLERLRRKYKPYIEPESVFPMNQTAQAVIKTDFTELIAEVKKLESENRGLAAHQCQHPASDEFGNAYCTEMERVKGENKRLKTHEKELLKLPSISAPDDWLAEIKKQETRITELETVLKLVQRWGKDSRSVGAWEVFQEVAKVLEPVTEQPVTVVDCTCVPCVCFSVITGDHCPGCDAYTCLAH